MKHPTLNLWSTGSFALGTALAFLPFATNGVEHPSATAPVNFNDQIRPIISGKCLQCHGQDEDSRKAKLRLDIRADAIKDKDGTRAIAPHDPKTSEVITRITSTDPDDVMPPPKEGNPLEQNEIDLLVRWIEEGAPYSMHWAFVKPEQPPSPTVQTRAWSENGIDPFVLEKLEKSGLNPSPTANRHTLIRRLSLDLTGLPPTPMEVAAFAEDPAPDAYERLVDRLLSSPAYGERWASVWLDLARYADSAGYGSDPLRLNIWPWRTWVIDALNQNMGYDQFTIEQLAGDLLPNPPRDQLIATGFHRNTMTNTEGGTDDEEYRVAAVKDRANTTAQVWMGLTMGCAQCHSHKYDPITQREYYQFYSFFNQTEDTDKPDDQPTLPLPTKEQKQKMDHLKAEIEGLERERDAITPDFESDAAKWESNQREGIEWQSLVPTDYKSIGGADLTMLLDNSILATGASPETDTYALTVRSALTNVKALRLELLPHDSLPKNGPGRAKDSGRVTVTEFKLAIRSPETEPPRTRFLRVELPGTQRILSLAEIQVFSEGENFALQGKAKQSSTQNGASAQRAIDGRDTGDFDAGSTTMTQAEDNPWWEVDFGHEVPLEEIVIWNRTDRGLGTRLAGFKVKALDADRSNVWEKSISTPPAPTAYLRVPKETKIKLQNASADFEEKELDVSEAIDNSENPKSGWSIGDQVGDMHAASFEIADAKALGGSDSLLIFTLSQKYGTNHTIGRFRISATTQSLPIRIPPKTITEVLKTSKEQRTKEEQDELYDYFRDFAPSLADINTQLKKLRRDLAKIKPVAVPVMRELPADKQRTNQILVKGNFLNPGDTVDPGIPAAFHPFPEETGGDRLGLARWILDPENPLTARVAVNRLWARLFGVGIVETEEDFGTQGATPTHPRLLDWLATSFQDNGWNMKALLKTIVMSATYKQSSIVTSELLEKDPRNRLYSRGPRRRLDAETVRDQALALSGLLSRKIGGPSVYPPQPDGLWRAAFNGQRNWATSKGEDRFRRGLYTFWRRTIPYPSMATFDAPSRENCSIRRIPTNTPLQAFVTMNDPVFVEASQALARRMVREGGATTSDRIRYGLQLCLARPPTEEQMAPIQRLFTEELEHYRKHEEEATQLATDPLGPLPEGLEPSDAAAWTVVANVLLNLDAVLAKN